MRDILNIFFLVFLDLDFLLHFYNLQMVDLQWQMQNTNREQVFRVWMIRSAQQRSYNLGHYTHVK